MSNKSNITPYIKAFSELSSSEEDFLAGVDVFEEIVKVLWSEKEFKDLLCSPAVKSELREEILKKALEAGNINELVVKVILVMLQKGKIASLPNFVVALREFADDKFGVLRGEVETAVKLGPESHKKITSLVSGLTEKEAILNYNTNEDLIGGVKVKFKNVVLDASLKKKLSEAKTKLLGKRA